MDSKLYCYWTLQSNSLLPKADENSFGNISDMHKIIKG
jgi:hypothetical protein